MMSSTDDTVTSRHILWEYDESNNESDSPATMNENSNNDDLEKNVTNINIAVYREADYAQENKTRRPTTGVSPIA